MAAALLASCSRTIENEEEAVLKVAVHDEAYKEQLNELWKETYPDTGLEISVVSQEEIQNSIANGEDVAYDVYWLEDKYVPLVIDELLEPESDVEVSLNTNFNDIFDKVRKVYQPIMAQGMSYYALDLNKIENDGIDKDTFKEIEKIAELDHGFYYMDDIYFTSAFLTSNLNYLPGRDRNIINFTGSAFQEALTDYQKILELIACDDPASFDNWFIQNTYYSGFVTDGMQLKQDEEVNQGRYQITKLPTINGHQLYTQAISYGYVINKDTAYPNAAKNLVKLMHSVKGMQLLCNDEIRIPLILEDQLDQFTFENEHIKEKTVALNGAISRNWVGIENKTEGALDFLYLDTTIEKMKTCNLEEIEACQNELDEDYQEWLK